MEDNISVLKHKKRGIWIRHKRYMPLYLMMLREYETFSVK